MPQGVCLQVKELSSSQTGIPCLEMGYHRKIS